MFGLDVYVIKANLLKEVTKQLIHDRYGDLAQSEAAFPSCKIGRKFLSSMGNESGYFYILLFSNYR